MQRVQNHIFVTKTLAGLLDLIRQLDDEIPAVLPDDQRLRYKAAQLGALLAGVWATCQRASIGARAQVRAAQHGLSNNPEVQVLLDRFRSVGPPTATFDVNLDLNAVKRGAALAESVIDELPDWTEAGADTYATWVGAVAGVFEGILEAGLNDCAWDALEVTRQTVLTLSDPTTDLVPVSEDN